MVTAAKNYYSDNDNLLPTNTNEQLTVDTATLTSLDYLTDINEMTKTGVTCSGKVIVSYNNEKYRYTPILECGESYKSQTLYSYIENNVERVFEGSGLYDLNGDYVYRGERPKNYLTLSNRLYRIVKLTDNHVVLILDHQGIRSVWDNRYNLDRRADEGINDYKVSRVKEMLDTAYKNNTLVSEEDRQFLAPQKVYTGKRKQYDNYNDGSIEKSDYLENQPIGLLPLYDFINASIDNNCNSYLTNSCVNYNYLTSYPYNWWTSTAYSDNSYQVYLISGGVMNIVKANTNAYARPVIYLVSDAIYVSGDGTKDNPYVVK